MTLTCHRVYANRWPNILIWLPKKGRPECSLVYQDDPGLNAVLAAMRRRGAAASKKLGTPECGPYAEGSASTGMSGGLSLALVRLLPRRSQTTTAAPAGTGHRRCHRALLSSTHMQDSLPGCGPASKPGSTNSYVLCPGCTGDVTAQKPPLASAEVLAFSPLARPRGTHRCRASTRLIIAQIAL